MACGGCVRVWRMAVRGDACRVWAWDACAYGVGCVRVWRADACAYGRICVRRYGVGMRARMAWGCVRVWRGDACAYGVGMRARMAWGVRGVRMAWGLRVCVRMRGDACAYGVGMRARMAWDAVRYWWGCVCAYGVGMQCGAYGVGMRARMRGVRARMAWDACAYGVGMRARMACAYGVGMRSAYGVGMACVWRGMRGCVRVWRCVRVCVVCVMAWDACAYGVGMRARMAWMRMAWYAAYGRICVRVWRGYGDASSRVWRGDAVRAYGALAWRVWRGGWRARMAWGCVRVWRGDAVRVWRWGDACAYGVGARGMRCALWRGDAVWRVWRGIKYVGAVVSTPIPRHKELRKLFPSAKRNLIPLASDESQPIPLTMTFSSTPCIRSLREKIFWADSCCRSISSCGRQPLSRRHCSRRGRKCRTTFSPSTGSHSTN
ncbi:hypothetical protein C7M84_002969 [Penaeus vannamei]|uniref:Uncharacterized protein n=1 Tax=Penaeus vannamei TaxID=6689 RepID=A0A423TPG7_PENVA|nr:hypothetical protein C7M84_002969 [Penaeus vannamei]